MTFEVINRSNPHNAEWISELVGIVRFKIEKLDADTTNVMIRDEDADFFTDWTEAHGLECRLV